MTCVRFIGKSYTQEINQVNIITPSTHVKEGYSPSSIAAESSPKPRPNKNVHFVPLKHHYTVVSMVAVFLKELVWLHVFPNALYHIGIKFSWANFRENYFVCKFDRGDDQVFWELFAVLRGWVTDSMGVMMFCGPSTLIQFLRNSITIILFRV